MILDFNQEKLCTKYLLDYKTKFNEYLLELYKKYNTKFH